MDVYVENKIFSYFWSCKYYEHVVIPLNELRKELHKCVDFIERHVLYNTSNSYANLSGHLQKYNIVLSECVKPGLPLFFKEEFPFVAMLNTPQQKKNVRNVPSKYRMICSYVLTMSGPWSNRVVRIFSGLP